jgi:hypothetical protein
MSRARGGVLLLVALAVAALASGCQTKAECEQSGGRWVSTWNPAQRYDTNARRWVGGWDEACQPAPQPAVRHSRPARSRPAQRKGGHR